MLSSAHHYTALALPTVFLVPEPTTLRRALIPFTQRVASSCLASSPRAFRGAAYPATLGPCRGYHFHTSGVSRRQEQCIQQIKPGTLSISSWNNNTLGAIMSGSTMGVDIRVPAEWTVEARVVEGKKCIGTHSGSFHCDEALACAMLKILPEWSDAVVVRTRDETELAKCDVVVDVGGVYDPATLRFDHHQKTFHDTLSEESFSTRLSSAGLVYRHFGRQILKQLVAGRGMPEDVVDKKLYTKVYKNFMEHIDAIDNGVDIAAGPLNYDVSSHLSARVAALNPSWNEPSDSDGPGGPNARFKLAMSLTGGELCSYVEGLSASWWPARSLVAEALSRRSEDHPSGEVMVLSTFCPWKSHLLELEKELGIAGQLKYVLYPEGDPAGKWRIQAVPKSEDSFVLRLPLPARWLGARDGELCKVSGIESCIFVHVNGFIGGNASKAGALAMAAKALEIAAIAAS